MGSILLVDDEPALLRGIGRYLTGLGHEVTSASNGREALEALARATPDVLITDINMPDMDGIEILNELRARESRLPVIAMSGGGKFDKRLLLASARMLGAVLTLEKPFELDELRRLVEQALSG